MKKRILALLLMVGMLLNSSIVMAADMTIASSEGTYSYDYEEGKTFEMDFKVSGNTGINNMTFFVKYDPTVIQAVDTNTYPEDIIGYDSGNGYSRALFDNQLINNQINLVPNAIDGDYEGKSDGIKSAAELGILKYSSAVFIGDENNHLLNATGDGTLLRLTFKIIGSGSTQVNLELISDINKVVNGGFQTVNADIQSAIVTISGNHPVTTETTTVTTATTTRTTETTTTSQSGSGYNNTTKVTSTTEAETETTTKSIEKTTEATTSDVKVTFSDIEDYPWAVGAIENLAGAGIVNGYENGTFLPNNSVKRADFLLMLLKAMGVDTTEKCEDNFTDVDSERYYYNVVGIAKSMGLANGNGDGTFSPDSTITRQDMMILAKRAMEISTGNTISADTSVLNKFEDKANISEYALESLAAMVNEGMVSGTGNNIEPKANTTRAQAAVIINRIYEKIK